MSDRKRRSDAFDAALSDEARGEIFAMMKTLPWPEVSDKCFEKFGVSPGKTALYDFVREMRQEESQRRIADALAHQASVRAAVSEIGDMDADMASGWEQLALESSLNGDLGSAEKYLNLAERLRARALERAKLDLKIAAEQRAGENLALAKAQFQEKLRSDLERGLQALYEQVANNPQAVGLVRDLQTLLGGESARG
jgi:hypothetical protein